ncbi:hypothetical protein LshimejAT787_1401910 [Lyophyllum shimeji]|uniref:Uncharacterized protein n=1 Tax=Lyophyllum shimeji TaxID=47721 RepID=A0A9P3PYA2_LYOSH|nr:hypothetical protein LshimejAT787_1401910 [Lyophyllum shimeji]
MWTECDCGKPAPISFASSSLSFTLYRGYCAYLRSPKALGSWQFDGISTGPRGGRHATKRYTGMSRPCTRDNGSVVSFTSCVIPCTYCSSSCVVLRLLAILILDILPPSLDLPKLLRRTGGC